MTRWKATGIHLALSILIVGGIGVSAFLLWHPYGSSGEGQLLIDPITAAPIRVIR